MALEITKLFLLFYVPLNDDRFLYGTSLHFVLAVFFIPQFSAEIQIHSCSKQTIAVLKFYSQFRFYPNTPMLCSGFCCRHMSVTFVRPIPGVKFFGAVYISHLLTSPSGALNARRVPSRAISDLSKAIWSHKRYKIRPRVQLMTNRKWHTRNSLV